MKDSTCALPSVENRLWEYFCSKIVSNLSHGVLTDREIEILEKSLDLGPIQRKIEE